MTRDIARELPTPIFVANRWFLWCNAERDADAPYVMGAEGRPWRDD